MALTGRNRTTPRVLALAGVLAFSLFSVHIPIAAASTHGKPDIEITIRVNQKGFFDERNKPLGPQQSPQDSRRKSGQADVRL